MIFAYLLTYDIRCDGPRFFVTKFLLLIYIWKLFPFMWQYFYWKWCAFDALHILYCHCK